jgi:hypothetical protein
LAHMVPATPEERTCVVLTGMWTTEVLNAEQLTVHWAEGIDSNTQPPVEDFRKPVVRCHGSSPAPPSR